MQAGDDKQLVAVVVNPMHHTNSTSITDWAMRKPGAVLHLVQRYTTQYWSVLARAGTPVAISDTPSDAQFAAALEQRNASGTTVVVAPLVSRHFDFLDSLISTETLPVPPALMHTAMSHTILLLGARACRAPSFLLLPPVTNPALHEASRPIGACRGAGSAPVGPTTVERMRKYAGKLPTVRFGSTETCLQVCTHSRRRRLYRRACTAVLVPPRLYRRPRATALVPPGLCRRACAAGLVPPCLCRRACAAVLVPPSSFPHAAVVLACR